MVMEIGVYKGQTDQKLRSAAGEAGLMPLVQTFSEVLQEVHDQESDNEMGGGLFREFIPMMVADVFGTDPKLGVGDDFYRELKDKKV